MKASFFLLAAALCANFPLFAQAPAIQWQNTIGGAGWDELSSLQQTADGGYIIGGESESGISGDKTENGFGFRDYWVVKLDATGAIQWQNNIGGDNTDKLTSLQQTADDGYIIGGYSESNISGDKTENKLGGPDFWVLKLSETGNIQWQNTIGGSSEDQFYSLHQTADGGFILGGFSNSNISGDKSENSLGAFDYWVLKLNATGAIQWQNTIGGNEGDYLTSLQQTADGGYIVGGSSLSNISGDKSENSLGGLDYWVLKLNAAGAIQWQNTIGGDSDDQLKSLQQTADGGYILGGFSSSDISGDKTQNTLGAYDFWVIKLNATGAIQWQNTIGSISSEFLNSLRQTADGGYILGGYVENNSGGTSYLVVKLDAVGTFQWQKIIGGSGDDKLASLQQTADAGYILGGSSDSNISGNKTENSNGLYDFWIIKLAPETVPTGEALTTTARVTIYPNPAADAVLVQASAETTLSLYNAFGQSFLTQTFHGNGKIELSSLPNGIYFLVEMETGIGHKILKK